MRTLFFTLMSIACSLALATTVYKWVDEDGVVHYSDQPHPNAQKLQVRDVQTYKPTALDTPAQNQAPAPAAATTGYQGCAVAQPADGQQFANIDSLAVVVHTDPQLHRGDQIYVNFDGQWMNGGAPTGPSFSVSPVDRGEHTVMATVKDSGGAVVCQTPTVTIYVQQASLFNPANPRAPH